MATILKNNKQEQLTENTKSGARFVLRSIICQELLAINSNVFDVNLSRKIRDYNQIDAF
jgi:hypothetical protein